MDSTLRESVCLYTDFDDGFDATFSRGDGDARIDVDRYAPRRTAGGGGRFGEAAAFIYEDQQESIWTDDLVRYAALDNFPTDAGRPTSGTIAMWIRVDLEDLKERSLIWLDPIHLLGPDFRQKGKMWMDLVVSELEGSPLFRFGATLPREERQNPDQTDEGHVIVVPDLQFDADRWHHIAGTWNGLNQDTPSGELTLYFDGARVGELNGFRHPLIWSIEDWEIRIGLGFKGLIDDLVILDHPLEPEEVATISNAGIPFGQLADL